MQKYRNQIIAGLVIALVIYAALLIFLDTESQLSTSVVEEFKRFPFYLIFVVILMQLLVGFFRFLEWHYFLGVIGAREKITLMDSVAIFTAGLVMVVSPGKSAELLKAVLLKTRTDVPVSRSSPVVVAERVVDGIAVIIATLVAVVLAGDDLDIGPYRVLIFFSVGLLATGLIVVQITSLAYRVLGIIERIPFINRFHLALVAFYESSYEIFQLRHLIPTTAMGIGVYLSSAGGFLVILHGFGVDVTWALFLQVTFMVGVTSAIGAFSFIPNGAGVTEVTNASLLLALVAPANPILTTSVAAAAAILQGIFHKWFRVMIGMLAVLIFRRRLFTPAVEAALDDLENENSHAQSYTVSESRA
ncbi:MAG: UPF0104 family protein [Chloroflexi bacterium]|nr:MAG: UPF0104 family protein [Chloroflexota bacterium]